MIAVVDFWVRLFPPAEPMDTVVEKPIGRTTVTLRSPVQISYGWQERNNEVRWRKQVLNKRLFFFFLFFCSTNGFDYVSHSLRQLIMTSLAAVYRGQN